MNVEQLVQSMTEETYNRLKLAVETGKWPNGDRLSPEQLENSLQMVMLYQAQVLQSDEHFTVGADGEIVTKSREQLKQQFSQQPSIARFKQDDF